MFNFEDSFRNWARVPIDDFEYMEADEILGLHPLQHAELVNIAKGCRWRTDQWRNKDNLLVEFMSIPGLDRKTVMDFGCGLGLDAAKFLELGANNVVLADLHPKMLLAAQRTLCLTGRIARRLILIRPDPPWFEFPIDLFWSLGVLHHTPRIAELLEQACRCLNPGGECRVVLYSDVRWRQMTNTEPVVGDQVQFHPNFTEYVKKCDAVGSYADWFNEEKLARTVEKFATVESCRYLSDDQFLASIIRPKKS